MLELVKQHGRQNPSQKKKSTNSKRCATQSLMLVKCHTKSKYNSLLGLVIITLINPSYTQHIPTTGEISISKVMIQKKKKSQFHKRLINSQEKRQAIQGTDTDFKTKLKSGNMHFRTSGHSKFVLQILQLRKENPFQKLQFNNSSTSSQGKKKKLKSCPTMLGI